MTVLLHWVTEKEAAMKFAIEMVAGKLILVAIYAWALLYRSETARQAKKSSAADGVLN